MLTLAISFSIFFLLFQLYLSTQKSYRAQAALNHLQYSASEAIKTLREGIHKAGYIGCARLTPNFPLQTSKHHPFNEKNKIEVKVASSLTVRYAEPTHALLLEDMRNRSVLQTDVEVEFQPHETLIISDCKHAEIFEVKHVHLFKKKQVILAADTLHSRYGKNSEVAHFVQDEYQIEPSDEKNADGTVSNALTVHRVDHTTDTVADYIDAMHIDVTLNQDGNMRDVPADEVNDWSQAIGLAITLHLSVPPYEKTRYFYAALHSA